MPVELFAPQLVRSGAPVCDLCGKVMNGFNCTCAVQRMWLYRASQGRLNISVCHIRDLTNDCIGGTNLNEMERVSSAYGISGQRYQPADVDLIFTRVGGGRHGSHFQIGYEPFVNTIYDRFFGRFRTNHDIYLSGPGRTSDTLRVGDPGATDFHDIPKSLLRQSAGMLALNDSGSVTLNDEAGRGKCYAYLTPADPETHGWWPSYAEAPTSAATFAVRFAPGSYPRFDSHGRKVGTFSTAKGFTAYGNTRFSHNGHIFGKLITDRPGYIVDATAAARYWSKH